MPQDREATPLRVVPNAPIEAQVDRVERDALVPELGLRIRDERRSWVVHHKVAGKVAKTTLGAAQTLSVEKARELARAMLRDPGLEPGLSPEITVETFADLFLAECAEQWKPSTRASHRATMQRSILPGLGTYKVVDLTRQTVTGWLGRLPPNAGSRNRALSVLSSLCRHAELRGLRRPGTNPCRRLRRRKSDFQAEYLDRAGFKALGKVLQDLEAEFPDEVRALRFLALTGCRKSEALQLTWRQIDGGRAALQEAKSGPAAIWLGAPAKQLLDGIPRHGEHVFGSGDAPLPAARLDRVWSTVRGRMNRPKLRIHDLRHSFASVGVRMGFDLLVVGGLLGHSDKGSTAGYAHLTSEDLAAFVDQVGSHLKSIVEPVKPSPKRGRRRDTELLEHCEVFLQSSLGLPAFCETHGLNQTAFRRALAAVRKGRPQ